MLKLLLIRHAQSLGNLEGRMEGQTSTPLSQQGWQQARRLGQYLLAENWYPTQIYCSPLLRATQTLTGLAPAFGWNTCGRDAEEAALRLPEAPPISLEPDLMEYDNGLLAGLTWSQANRRYPQLCDQLMTNLDWVPIPQAESLRAGRGRATQFWRRLVDAHGNQDRLWIITHHWLLQQLLSVALGCDRTWGIAIGHTACFEIWLDCDRWKRLDDNRWNSELWQLRRFNDCQHLHG